VVFAEEDHGRDHVEGFVKILGQIHEDLLPGPGLAWRKHHSTLGDGEQRVFAQAV